MHYITWKIETVSRWYQEKKGLCEEVLFKHYKPVICGGPPLLDTFSVGWATFHSRCQCENVLNDLWEPDCKTRIALWVHSYKTFQFNYSINIHRTLKVKKTILDLRNGWVCLMKPSLLSYVRILSHMLNVGRVQKQYTAL